MANEEEGRGRLDIRPEPDLVEGLDRYIKRRPGNLSRAEVARTLIREGIERDDRAATKKGAKV